MTLYTCAGTQGVVLDIVPHLDSASFIKSFRRFICRRGCPSFVISDNGCNFVSKDTVEFVNGLGVEWKLNLPLAPWHGGFFERMVRTMKSLLRKSLQRVKLNLKYYKLLFTKLNRLSIIDYLFL